MWGQVFAQCGGYVHPRRSCLGFLGLLEVCFGGQHRAVRLSSSLNPCNLSSIHLASTSAFSPRIVAASLGYVRLCGVKFWHNVGGLCISGGRVRGSVELWKCASGVGIGQYDLSSSLNPAM